MSKESLEQRYSASSAGMHRLAACQCSMIVADWEAPDCNLGINVCPCVRRCRPVRGGGPCVLYSQELHGHDGVFSSCSYAL